MEIKLLGIVLWIKLDVLLLYKQIWCSEDVQKKESAIAIIESWKA